MVDAISSVNSLNSKRCERPQVAFKGEQAPVDMEQKPDTFEKENEVTQTTEEKQGMSTGKKVAIGIGSLLALVAAGFGIKKGLDIKAANKALKEAANAVGIEDVNVYKTIKSAFGNISACEYEKLDYSDVISKVKDLYKQGKIEIGDKLVIMPNSMLAKIFEEAKLKVNVPENAIAIAIESASGKEFKYQEFIMNKGLTDGFKDLLPKDKNYVQLFTE
ncbi:MAG: hypothetical protein VZR09_07355 [Candidatus Gastranaerophilaceae bacterium]|nr:hypothetical protein [Candidatus Gastranaerophilaceae bacterium]